MLFYGIAGAACGASCPAIAIGGYSIDVIPLGGYSIGDDYYGWGIICGTICCYSGAICGCWGAICGGCGGPYIY